MNESNELLLSECYMQMHILALIHMFGSREFVQTLSTLMSAAERHALSHTH